MGRLHLFELEDQSWFPGFLRNYGTDFLRFMSNTTKMYKPVIPVLEKGLKRSKTNQILDLGSGGGGGIIWINSQLRASIRGFKIVLTDYYPNIAAFQYTKERAGNIDFLEKPIDARDVPENLEGLRTLFFTFHHFRPKDAKMILQNAVDSNKSIAIFEAQGRNLPSFLAMFLSPVNVFLTTPFIRPFKIGRIVFTYFIPLIPLFVWWDGIISVIRTYSLKEMRALVEEVRGTENYDWEIAKIRSGPGFIFYLLGTEKEK